MLHPQAPTSTYRYAYPYPDLHIYKCTSLPGRYAGLALLYCIHVSHLLLNNNNKQTKKNKKYQTFLLPNNQSQTIQPTLFSSHPQKRELINGGPKNSKWRAIWRQASEHHVPYTHIHIYTYKSNSTDFATTTTSTRDIETVRGKVSTISI